MTLTSFRYDAVTHEVLLVGDENERRSTAVHRLSQLMQARLGHIEGLEVCHREDDDVGVICLVVTLFRLPLNRLLQVHHAVE